MSRSAEVKEVEEFPKRIRIFILIMILLFIAGIFGFKLITGISFGDSFLRTLQTLAFIFNEESTIYERLLEIFLAIVGVFIIWWVLWSIADMLLDGNLRKYLKTRFYSFLIKRMKNHIIIVGGGRVGEEIAKVISVKKIPFLIIESDPAVASSLRKKKYMIIEGSGLNEEMLKKARIEKALKLIIASPNTEDNVMITLTAKEMNPKIEVHSRCEKPSLVSKLKKAGAKIVTVPEIIAGDKIADDLGI
ncbi:NAD-binding protein [Candidatus Pacearchaeota archaeon]|nr:NAD-binding protein [Candidatus Pacearchaeota archaeon]